MSTTTVATRKPRVARWYACGNTGLPAHTTFRFTTLAYAKTWTLEHFDLIAYDSDNWVKPVKAPPVDWLRSELRDCMNRAKFLRTTLATLNA